MSNDELTRIVERVVESVGGLTKIVTYMMSRDHIDWDGDDDWDEPDGLVETDELPTDAWTSFLDEHPELKGQIVPEGKRFDGAPRPEHYSYSTGWFPYADEQIVAAVGRACSRKPGGVTAHEVIVALCGSLDESRASLATGEGTNWLSVGMAPLCGRLHSLSMAGAIVHVRKRQGAEPALWAVGSAPLAES